MPVPLTPSSIRPPMARYSHGMEVAAGSRLVFCSGQVGMRPDGTVPQDAAEQVALCFANIAAVLAEAGLGLDDVVRLNAYVTDRAYLQSYRNVRDHIFSDPAPAATLLVVAGLASPELKVEIEAVAAGAPL